ncbi:hypothetical protein GCM10010324_35230 [Streptomyces hiroshimensis]|uniref:Uncharacterized protein n=1 Tax=Streptomyces hiroshimensis TaxID=66424 RepID=A0ABQ2YKF5_9ACTN|nr:hypothetical protein GCM10010324_35230 [Streptomyces hiroshimensis]
MHEGASGGRRARAGHPARSPAYAHGRNAAGREERRAAQEKSGPQINFPPGAVPLPDRNGP